MDHSSTTARLELPSTPQAGRIARGALRDLCAASSVGDDTRETVLLLANELVTNAVEHAGGEAVLDAVVRDGAIRVEVTDSSPAIPQAPDALGGDLDERGRGLFLIAALASRWGADRRPQGKTVWCELDLGTA